MNHVPKLTDCTNIHSRLPVYRLNCIKLLGRSKDGLLLPFCTVWPLHVRTFRRNIFPPFSGPVTTTDVTDLPNTLAMLSYVTDTFIPSHHFSIHLHQNVYPEDGSRWSLRNVGTFNRHTAKTQNKPLMLSKNVVKT